MVRFCIIVSKNFTPRSDFVGRCKISPIVKFFDAYQQFAFKQWEILTIFGLFWPFWWSNGLYSYMFCEGWINQGKIYMFYAKKAHISDQNTSKQFFGSPVKLEIYTNLRMARKRQTYSTYYYHLLHWLRRFTSCIFLQCSVESCKYRAVYTYQH